MTFPALVGLENSNEKKPLEIIGLELNRSAHSKSEPTDHSSIKSSQLITLNPKIRFSRINQTMLQVPRRSTFSHSRRTGNTFLLNKYALSDEKTKETKRKSFRSVCLRFYRAWTPQTTDVNGQTTTTNKSTTDEVSFKRNEKEKSLHIEC